MHPQDCPTFEYSNHPDAVDVLREKQTQLLRQIESGLVDATAASTNTRPYHRHLFHELCPPHCFYYAGHYRGDSHRCLKFYEVSVGSDSLVGYPPSSVSGALAELAVSLRADIAGFDAAFRIPRVQLSPSQRVLYIVAFACRVFVQFLTIHPYANGNGHIARFILTIILYRYGIGLKEWAIDPRPSPPYSELISKHRRGDHEPLEMVILRQCVPLYPP
jgi:hypothetical protein